MENKQALADNLFSYKKDIQLHVLGYGMKNLIVS